METLSRTKPPTPHHGAIKSLSQGLSSREASSSVDQSLGPQGRDAVTSHWGHSWGKADPWRGMNVQV